ncbi:DMT family transporter [Pseudovibrio sp. SPO723]|uniref:DMT family transporter n=1 Tax=Nesiotobacter zosterae TaxID=392721 RepID=UPI0029C3550E|nr:DMT family transporter [Pseudovibrio sp. SPO723]MDX5593806.1 DMT family transporter [Pseudovibrio sp. SPO723]
MFMFEMAALGAALCWAVGGLISSRPSAHLGAIGFNCVRMWFVVAMTLAYALVSGALLDFDFGTLDIILISGFVGIFLGDTALFLTLNRMGPRRTSILFAMNAPISAVLGWIFLGEDLSALASIGILTVVVGVVLAIVFGKRKDQLHQWESIKGPVVVGVALGLVAALSQSLGSLVIRPVMQGGADPVVVALLRCLVAATCLTMLMQLPNPRFKLANPLTGQIVRRTALSGFLGMGLGMTLLLFALEGGEVGIVSTLSATSPALLLPMLWWRTREKPAMGAWIGAALVVIGCGLIFTS